eukprot:CAMPEP_0195536058 /NCGR_PEP_ID=MMETSP0794_2-20130614/45388_1 /TAXON_ID=515487 /ORGANISM="Stephanopyxis turris, Strain CCMP 815" /LENGTH=32 /DNA_ID= /DNA_START= /DNA_END= /DNA_ORIENTATION=
MSSSETQTPTGGGDNTSGNNSGGNSSTQGNES